MATTLEIPEAEVQDFVDAVENITNDTEPENEMSPDQLREYIDETVDAVAEVAIHHGKCTHKTQETLSTILDLTRY